MGNVKLFVYALKNQISLAANFESVHCIVHVPEQLLRARVYSHSNQHTIFVIKFHIFNYNS